MVFTIEQVHGDLLKAKERGMVTIKPTPEGTLIVKYTRKCMYEDGWTPTIINFARGHSFDQDFTRVVCNPFPKTFNPGEKRGREFHDEVTAAYGVKYNGYMLSATMHNGELYVSTTGTTTSDYAKLGRKWLEGNAILSEIREDNGAHTYMFEVCDPSDPHIVPENPGLYLIGIRSNTLDTSSFNELALQYAPYSALKERVKWVTHEGFMAWKGEQCVKLKSPYYVCLKKLARCFTDTTPAEGRKVKLDHAINFCLTKYPDHPVFGDKNNYRGVPEILDVNDEQIRLTYLRDLFRAPMLRAREEHDA